MAQPRWIQVKNFNKYQHYGKRNPPWIKLYKSILTDHAFLKLPSRSRYLYIGLLILASECDNKVANDPAYIGHRLAISVAELDLRPLFRAGFLLASDRTIRRLRDREESETETEERQSRGEGERTRPSGNGRCAFPLDFEFTSDRKEWAEKQGVHAALEFNRFRDYHKARDTRFKDWDAAWRNWVRKAKELQNQGVSHVVRPLR